MAVRSDPKAEGAIKRTQGALAPSDTYRNAWDEMFGGLGGTDATLDAEYQSLIQRWSTADPYLRELIELQLAQTAQNNSQAAQAYEFIVSTGEARSAEARRVWDQNRRTADQTQDQVVGAYDNIAAQGYDANPGFQNAWDQTNNQLFNAYQDFAQQDQGIEDAYRRIQDRGFDASPDFLSRWDETQGAILAGALDMGAWTGEGAINFGGEPYQELRAQLARGTAPVSTARQEQMYGDLRRDYLASDPNRLARQGAIDARIRAERAGQPTVGGLGGAAQRHRASLAGGLASVAGYQAGYQAGAAQRAAAAAQARVAASDIARTQLANRGNNLGAAAIWGSVLRDVGRQLGVSSANAVNNLGNLRGHLADQNQLQSNAFNTYAQARTGARAAQANAFGTLGQATAANLGSYRQHLGDKSQLQASAFGDFSRFQAARLGTDAANLGSYQGFLANEGRTQMQGFLTTQGQQQQSQQRAFETGINALGAHIGNRDSLMGGAFGDYAASRADRHRVNAATGASLLHQLGLTELGFGNALVNMFGEEMDYYGAMMGMSEREAAREEQARLPDRRGFNPSGAGRVPSGYGADAGRQEPRRRAPLPPPGRYTPPSYLPSSPAINEWQDPNRPGSPFAPPPPIPRYQAPPVVGGAPGMGDDPDSDLYGTG